MAAGTRVTIQQKRSSLVPLPVPRWVLPFQAMAIVARVTDTATPIAGITAMDMLAGAIITNIVMAAIKAAAAIIMVATKTKIVTAITAIAIMVMAVAMADIAVDAVVVTAADIIPTTSTKNRF
jgi:hypothetical protein